MLSGNLPVDSPLVHKGSGDLVKEREGEKKGSLVYRLLRPAEDVPERVLILGRRPGSLGIGNYLHSYGRVLAWHQKERLISGPIR